VAANTNPAWAPHNGYSTYSNKRGGFTLQVQLSQAQILEKAAAVPQQPNMEGGIWQYEADVNLWHQTYGTEGIPSLERPYPLHPGTAVVGSGECYSCRMVMELTHLSSQCTTTNQLCPHEMRWCQQVAGLLWRTIQQQATQNLYPAPVYYVAQANHPYPQPYGNQVSTTAYTVTPQEEQMWGDQYDAMGTMEAGQDWTSENYGGPLQTLDQQ